MAKQQQLTPEQLEEIRRRKNEQFMALTYEQPIPAQAQNGTQYGLGKNLNFDSPIVASAYATKVTIRHKLQVTVSGISSGGQVRPSASYPYSLVNQVQILYGQKVATFHPYITKVFAMMEGYARKEFDNVAGYRSQTIDNLLRSVPTQFTSDGTFDVRFDTTYELNQLHPASANGLLPIFSSGVRLQVQVTTPSQVASENADPLDHAFEVEGGASVTVQGDIEVIIHYRDNQSMTTRQNLELDLNGLPTVQLIQLPTANMLAQGTYNHVPIRNPYPFAKIIHIVMDGKQADKFASADNIIGYTLDKAENTNSSFLRYDETTGGMVNYYARIRDKFGHDMDEGIIVHDFTTDNIANVSSKTGGAYLNLTGEGYPAARFGVKLNSVDNSTRVSRIVSYGVILNGEGIQTR